MPAYRNELIRSLPLCVALQLLFISSPALCLETNQVTRETEFGPVTEDTKFIQPVAGESKAGPKPDVKRKDLSKKTDVELEDIMSKAQSEPPVKQARVMFLDKGVISSGALQLAKDLKIVPQMARLEEMKKTKTFVPGEPSYSLEVLSVRQDLSESLLSAMLQARRVISELDRQISGYDAVARVLEEKRDDAIQKNTALNFSTSGVLTSTQGGLSIGTPARFQNAGNALAAIAGGLLIGISAYGLKIQDGGKRNEQRNPNMLAPIFGLIPVQATKYPPLVWNYLNDYEPGQKRNRRQQLLERWLTVHYIEPFDKPTSHHHLSQLAGTTDLHKEITIDLLRDRIPMLEDVRNTVASMFEYLDELNTFVREPR